MRFSASVATSVGVAMVAQFVSTAPSDANPISDFYNGKSITLLIGHPAGGGYDTYSRLLARHLGRFIPGNPGIIPKNMPGAGGLAAANSIYNSDPRDGLLIGMFGSFVAFEPLFGNDNAKFESAKFTWIGNMYRDVESCVVWHTTGIERYSDVDRFTETNKRPLIFGSSGKASTTSQTVHVMKNMLGSNVKVILGYKGTDDINLDMEKGAIDASCGMYLSTVRSRYDQKVKSGDLRILIQFGRSRVPYFGDAATIYDLLKSEEDKKVADIIFRQSELGRPIMGPPDIPTERAIALRSAFTETMKDPGFLSEAEKLRIPIDSTTGEEVAQLLGFFFGTPQSLIQRAKSAMTD